MTGDALVVIFATILVLGGSFGLTVLINKRHTRTASQAEDDWNIGGRDLPIFVIVGTQFASAMGGGVLVGQVGNAYANGIAMLVYAVFSCLPFLIYMFIANWIREKEFETIPDMVGTFCNNDKAVRILASIMTIVVPFGWLISQLTAFAKIYQEITGISLPILIVAMAVVSLLFVMPSGMKTVAWTDFFFACFMMVMVVATFAYVYSSGGSFSDISANVPQEIIEFPEGLVSVGWSTVFLWIFSTLPGGMTNQMYFQRICALKNKKQVNKSLIISFCVIFVALAWSCYMGLGIRAMNPNLESENATGWLLTQMPTLIIALFAAFIVATIMSTISSAVQSVVVNITHDIYQVVKPETGPEKVLRLSKILSVVVMAVSAVLSIIYPNVLDWIVATYAYSAAGLAVPMYIGYALRNKNFLTPVGLRVSIVCGVLGCIVATIAGSSLPFVIWGMLASLAGLLIACAVTKKGYYSLSN